ncbi:bifunctional hydroxymethylpyrimidine kinase/phosphomethylpyrimidine kinase [uncultured Cloacibacillus sp.]|uniref:bifunctional hydroxymethylpyrimidine kinase/phosphomethylpyrimidine kinase n=1 Tax=uncultured Cloacibacillus sp. TaxID=889794 RepID=UPI003208056F
MITDVLYADGKMTLFEDRRIDTTANHGTGCTLSSAIARSSHRAADLKRQWRASPAALSARRAALRRHRGTRRRLPRPRGYDAWTEIING